MSFTDQDFQALAQRAAQMGQQEARSPVSATPLQRHLPIIIGVGGGVVLLMGLGIVSGLMQRQAKATPEAAIALPSPSPTPTPSTAPSVAPSPTPTPSPVAPAIRNPHIVIGDNQSALNMRDTQGNIIGAIPTSAVVSVVQDLGDGTAIVEYNGGAGIVAKKFLMPIRQDKVQSLSPENDVFPDSLSDKRWF